MHAVFGSYLFSTDTHPGYICDSYGHGPANLYESGYDVYRVVTNDDFLKHRGYLVTLFLYWAGFTYHIWYSVVLVLFCTPIDLITLQWNDV